jgi:alpha-ribazole phosphatase
MAETEPELWVWRHPSARGAGGRCIGRTDLAVDPRRAKRLAHRIRHTARRHRLARVVFTSPLRRCADVGRWLRRWGWQHCIEPALLEMDFGAWDGRPWAHIARSDIDDWCDDFLQHRPGQGESLATMLQRVAIWPPLAGACIVGHGGWMLAWQWLASGRPPPQRAADWPAAPRHGACWRLPSRLPPFPLG